VASREEKELQDVFQLQYSSSSWPKHQLFFSASISSSSLLFQAYRRVASREEKELQDVERCMEEELVAEHMQVERVIHLRLENKEGQQQLKYLVKVSHLAACVNHTAVVALIHDSQSMYRCRSHF